MATHTILELGGNRATRIPHAAFLAQRIPTAQIIISTESEPALCLSALQAAGIPRERIIFDYNAWDTVTNFTLTYPLVKRLGTTHLHIVTDGFHMARSMSIARMVYLGRDVDCIPEAANAGTPEPAKLIRDDTLRAALWRFTGYQHKWQGVYDQRWPSIQQMAAEAASL